jgi:hypothetical protein
MPRCQTRPRGHRGKEKAPGRETPGAVHWDALRLPSALPALLDFGEQHHDKAPCAPARLAQLAQESPHHQRIARGHSGSDLALPNAEQGIRGDFEHVADLPQRLDAWPPTSVLEIPVAVGRDSDRFGRLGLSQALTLASSAQVARQRRLQERFSTGIVLIGSAAHRAVRSPARESRERGPGFAARARVHRHDPRVPERAHTKRTFMYSERRSCRVSFVIQQFRHDRAQVTENLRSGGHRCLGPPLASARPDAPGSRCFPPEHTARPLAGGALRYTASAHPCSPSQRSRASGELLRGPPRYVQTPRTRVRCPSYRVQTPQRQGRGPFTSCADASAPAPRPCHTVCGPLSAGAEALAHCVQTPRLRNPRRFPGVCRRLSAGPEALSHCVQTPQRRRRGPFTLCADASAPAQRSFPTLRTPADVRPEPFPRSTDPLTGHPRPFHTVCGPLAFVDAPLRVRAESWTGAHERLTGNASEVVPPDALER